VAITTNIDNTARTTRQIAEVQRDSYVALAENLAAAQRRSLRLAEGGLEFVRLQEENARAAQEWFANCLRLLKLQQRNAEFVRGWTGEAVEALREQTEHNAQTAEAFGRGISKQQEEEAFGGLACAWAGSYREILSALAYIGEGVRTFQGAAKQGLRVAEQATEHTDEVLKQAEKATREAELRTAVFGALKSADYEELTVEGISGRQEGLSTEELRKVREFEKQNKNRESLIDRIDRKIRAKDS
jgi:hypothetical protein